jgi:hypothetical protein
VCIFLVLLIIRYDALYTQRQINPLKYSGYCIYRSIEAILVFVHTFFNFFKLATDNKLFP